MDIIFKGEFRRNTAFHISTFLLIRVYSLIVLYVLLYCVVLCMNDTMSNFVTYFIAWTMVFVFRYHLNLL